MTFKNAIQEMVGERKPPNLNCHFSGDYQKNPSWTMNFDKEYAVKSIKIFNMKNGAVSSNFEGASIYIGDTICSRVGLQLPENDYVTMVCQDPDSGPRNIFEDAGKPKIYPGTKGTSVKI
jgi:hypothetical protein